MEEYNSRLSELNNQMKTLFMKLAGVGGLAVINYGFLGNVLPTVGCHVVMVCLIGITAIILGKIIDCYNEQRLAEVSVITGKIEKMDNSILNVDKKCMEYRAVLQNELNEKIAFVEENIVKEIMDTNSLITSSDKKFFAHVTEKNEAVLIALQEISQDQKMKIETEKAELLELVQKLIANVNSIEAKEDNMLQSAVRNAESIKTAIDNKATEITSVLGKTEAATMSAIADLSQHLKEKEALVEVANEDIAAKIDDIVARGAHIDVVLEVVNNLLIFCELNEVRNSQPALEPDRTEEIYDKEREIKLVRTYKGNKLVLVNMFKQGKLNFQVDFDDNGMMKSSRSFDEKGNLLQELMYYPNQQIKSRRELKATGETVDVEFDEQGNKLGKSRKKGNKLGKSRKN